MGVSAAPRTPRSWLYVNTLTGTIPPQLSTMTSMTYLYVRTGRNHRRYARQAKSME